MRIGFDTPFEPFAWVDNGQPRGMLIDLVSAALDAAGQPHRFEPLALDRSEHALIHGDVDALAFKGITPERCAILAFSAPLIDSGAAVFTRPGLVASDNLRDFAGHTLATPGKGPLAGAIESDYPEIRLLRVASYRESFEAVLAGRADLAALNFHVGMRMARRDYPGRFSLPDAPCLPVTLALAARVQGSSPFIARFDEALARIRADSIAQSIIARWSTA